MEQCLSSSVVWWGSLSTLVVSLILWVFALFQLSASRQEATRASLLRQNVSELLDQLGPHSSARSPASAWGVAPSVSVSDFTETKKTDQ